MTPYWQGDGITLYLGDCLEILPTLAAGSVDLVMTDPPFSVPVKYHDHRETWPRCWGDLNTLEPFFRDVFKEFKRVTSDDGQVYVCCDGETYPVMFKASYSIWPQSHMLVWYKPSGRHGRGWRHSHEIVLHLRTAETTYSDGFRQDVIGIMPVRTLNRQHPVEKPGDLWTFLSEGMPKPTYTVLDPFVGAGGLLEWARARGLQAIGIEIEERYAERAARRLDQGILTEATA